MSAEAGFETFVRAREVRLLRLGWLLTGEWPLAEDLLQTALVRVWPRWERLEASGAESYVRQVMVHQASTWWRRRWHGERPTGDLPERPAGDVWATTDLAEALRVGLGGLPARQRATLVLRYFEDLTEVQTAHAMGCSVGTVKSQTSKALASLRADPRLAGLLDETERVP